MKKRNNIVLIGFMGVGKGTVARALYKLTGKFAIDCDDMIESLANMKISEIFKTKGEDEFRKMESDLAKFLLKNVNNAIISTGGGFYKTKNLEKLGEIVYLKGDFDYIINRIKTSTNATKKIAKRPLLKNLEKAKELHSQRDLLYAKKADITINVENKTPKQIAKEIVKNLKYTTSL